MKKQTGKYFPVLVLLSLFFSVSASAALEEIEYISQTSNGTGYYVRSPDHPSGNNFVGQTFTTPSNCKYINYIELTIDSNAAQWSEDETITLTLYNSTSKTVKISEATLGSSTEGNLRKFYLKTSISPNTSYYMELSHNGGGDERVGWIVATSSSTYSGGAAYQGNTTLTQLAGDLYFRVCGNDNDFLISLFYLPGYTITNSTQYDMIKEANFNKVMVLGCNDPSYPGDELKSQDSNEDILDLCSSRGIIVQNNEEAYLDNLSNTEIDAVVNRYKDHSANGGFFIRDEPSTSKFADCANAYNRVLAITPDKIPHVNLYSIGAGKDTLGVLPIECVSQTANGTGYYVQSSLFSSGRNYVGQTFKTPEDCSYIEYIELNIDASNWAPEENLVLTLYDSTSKTTKLCSARLDGGSITGNYPKFYLETSVTPDTTYYMELSHIGIGDNIVGWVVASSSDTYADGAAYQGYPTLSQQSGDLYFRIFRGRSSKDKSICQTTIDAGSYLTTSQSLGQTFKTPSGLKRRLNFIEVSLSCRNWSGNEPLTMTVYDSPAKKQILGSATERHPDILSFSQEVFSQGDYVSSSQSKGQTFTTPSDCTFIDSIVMGIDTSDIQWSSNETLTLSLYDSPAKNELLGSDDVTSSEIKVANRPKFYVCADVDPNTQYYMELTHAGDGNNSIGWVVRSSSDVYSGGNAYLNGVIDQDSDFYFEVYNELQVTQNVGITPRFYLNAALKPDTTYYFELTHEGGGDNSVGWVTKSASNTYSDGTAYVNGSATTGDFYFRTIYRNFYQDYLEEWVEAVGAEKLKYLSYDHYPFRVNSNSISSKYFLSLELERDIGLQNNVRTACYLQSVGISGNLRRPDADEMRYNVFTTLAYGVKQIEWFTYATPIYTSETFDDAIIDVYGAKTDLFAPLKSLNTQVKNWGPTLMTLKSQAVYHNNIMEPGTQSVPDDFWWKSTNAGDNIIISYFKNHDGRKYIMVVNRELESTVTYYFNISPAPTMVTEVLKSTGAEVNTNYSSGSLSAPFVPGEGRLYALPAGY